MTAEKIEELVKVIYQQALQGDMRAAKLIRSYSVGQPRPAVDPDRLDTDEMDVFGKQAGSPEEFERILHSPTARMMCMLLQTMVPGFEKEALGKLAAGIKEMDERERNKEVLSSEVVSAEREKPPSRNGNCKELATGTEVGATNVPGGARGCQGSPGVVTNGRDDEDAPPSANGDSQGGREGSDEGWS